MPTIFSDAYLEYLIEQAAVEFSVEVPGLWYQTSLAITAGEAHYDIPDFVKLLDVSWLGESIDPLISIDLQNSPDIYKPNSGGSQSRPYGYMTNLQGARSLRFFPTPNVNIAADDSKIEDTEGIIDIVVVAGYVHHTVDYSIPDYLFRNLMKYRCGQRAYAREGDGQNLKAAKFFESQYLQLLPVYKEIFGNIPKVIQTGMQPLTQGNRSQRRIGRLPSTGAWSF